MSPRSPTREQALAVLDQRRAAAEAAVMTATGGHPLCRVGDGAAAGSAKHGEGRLAALAELRRSLIEATAPRPSAAARVLLARWEAERERVEGGSAAWVAYRRGGVEELHMVVADLDRLFIDQDGARCR